MPPTGIDIIKAAMSCAHDLTSAGKPVKGILVSEETYALAQQQEPVFNGTVRVWTSADPVEFYVMGLSSTDAARLGLNGLGDLGVVFTAESKEQLEEKLRSF
jgi:hypothetical protein